MNLFFYGKMLMLMLLMLIKSAALRKVSSGLEMLIKPN